MATAPADAVPHVRLGVAWAVVVVGAAAIGTAALAILLGATAALAAAGVVRTRRPGRMTVAVGAAAAGAAVIVVAGAAGAWPLAGAAALVAVAAPAAVILGRGGVAPTRQPVTAAASAGLAIVIGVPAGAVVLLRATHGATVTLVFLATVLLYDAAVFIVGTGAANGWEGPAAGIVTMVPLTVIVASVLSPPFHGESAWVLGAVLAVSCPAGAVLAAHMVGRHRVPALGRLDTLLVAGPAWALLAAFLHVG